jgi:signal transduction histidine kinase
VRNPLFSISANLDAFEAEFGSRPEYGELLALMREEVERLAALMRELLDYGRPAEGLPSLGTIGAIAADAVGSCAGFARRSAVQVVNDVGKDFGPLPMDKQRLVQVLQNVLQNAIQHTPRDGVVALSATTEQDANGLWVVLEVNDPGPGFAPDDLPRVFEPFFSRRRGGTGLGLAIAQRIVEEHGGTIAAANRPGGGARVALRLPCVPPAARDFQP